MLFSFLLVQPADPAMPRIVLAVLPQDVVNLMDEV